MGKIERKVKNTFLRLLKKNLREIIIQEGGPALIKTVLDQYELELYGIAPESDPTAPEYWQDEFSALLYVDLEESIEVTDTGVSFGLGDKFALGFDDPPSPESQDVLKTFAWILEGTIGEFAWITRDIYESKRGPGSWDDWGRFDIGFLIPEEVFNAEGWDSVISFEEARFGFSGEAPKDIFTNAYAGFDWSPYLVKAVEKAAKELQRIRL